MVAAMHEMTGDMSFFPRSSWITPDQAKERLSALEGRMCSPHVSFPDYLETLQSNGQAQCTTVWTKGTVAYRCRTCQVNDSRFAIEYIFPSFLALFILSLSFAEFTDFVHNRSHEFQDTTVFYIEFSVWLVPRLKILFDGDLVYGYVV